MTARDLEKHQKLGMFGLASKAKVFLSVHVDDMQDGGSQRKLYSDLGKLSKEDPTLSSNTTNGSSVLRDALKDQPQSTEKRSQQKLK